MRRTPPVLPGRDLIGYEGSPPSGLWPGGCTLAVSFVINVGEGAERSPLYGDTVAEGLGEMSRAVESVGIRDLATESIYEYGARVGCSRLVRLLLQDGVRFTAFVAAKAVEENQWLATTLRNPNVEICGYGYRWTEVWTWNRDREAQEIRRAVRVLADVLGMAPVGWYDRWMPSLANRELLVEIGGYLYDSNSYNDETPYYVTVGD